MRRHLALILSAGLALGLATPLPLLAGSARGPGLNGYSADQLNAIGVTNVPDRNGCVKWCFRDLNPCDPPEFKRADGRCFDD